LFGVGEGSVGGPANADLVHDDVVDVPDPSPAANRYGYADANPRRRMV
jgi:hypothetical protein